jgi:ATP-dependent DNA ligase
MAHEAGFEQAHELVFVRASTARISASARSKRSGMLMRPIERGDVVRFEALAAEGAVVLAKARELGLEGIVSKRSGSFDKSGKSRN